MTTLILQVLGNSDITSGDLKGWETLTESDSSEGIKRRAGINFKKFCEEKTDFDFPLIRKLLTATEGVNSSTALFCFILTDQTEWQSQRSETGQGWANIVAKDGIWWKDILATWCDKNNIKQYSIPFKIETNLLNGTADWEGMAEKIEKLFKILINFEGNSIYFQPTEGESIPIDNIIVQHSSGTPALNGAFYLWGIERKLTGNPIDFVYISEEQLECETHSGTHWQWHLKVPQIRELLKIQDFSGALQILKSHPHSIEEIKTKLKKLDRAVSLNLIGRENLAGREGIIERVAIAVWSETAFRDRSQWMHWYLRVAGAFELVILLLVEKQGKGKYQWRNIKLMDNSQKLEVSRINISQLVTLLTEGKLEEIELFGKSYNAIEVEAVGNIQNWEYFAQFYNQSVSPSGDGWSLGVLPKNEGFLGFTQIRNKLYHSLLGDRIDELLDKKTGELGSVTHPEHPAQVAVDYLHFIIDLAGLTDEVKTRADRYRQIVREIEENL